MNKIRLVFCTVLIIFSFSCKDIKANNNKDVNAKNDVVDKIAWKHGIAFFDNAALYIDPEKMEEESIVISENAIKKTEGAIIYGSTIIFIDGNSLYIYNSEKSDPYFRLPETKKELKYKIENNSLMISENGSDWDKLIIELVEEYKPAKESEYGEPIYMLIKLKCKWFENYYEIIGTPG